jgi:hypothetical protein
VIDLPTTTDGLVRSGVRHDAEVALKALYQALRYLEGTSAHATASQAMKALTAGQLSALADHAVRYAGDGIRRYDIMRAAVTLSTDMEVWMIAKLVAEVERDLRAMGYFG